MKNVNFKKDKYTTIAGFMIVFASLFIAISQVYFEVHAPIPLWILGLALLAGVWLIYSADSFFSRVNKSIDKRENKQ